MILQMSMDTDPKIATDSRCRCKVVYIMRLPVSQTAYRHQSSLMSRVKFALYNDQDIIFPMTLYLKKQNCFKFSHFKIFKHTVNPYSFTVFVYLGSTCSQGIQLKPFIMQVTMTQMSVRSASGGIELFSIAPIPNPALLDT